VRDPASVGRASIGCWKRIQSERRDVRNFRTSSAGRARWGRFDLAPGYWPAPLSSCRCGCSGGATSRQGAVKAPCSCGPVQTTRQRWRKRSGCLGPRLVECCCSTARNVRGEAPLKQEDERSQRVTTAAAPGDQCVSPSARHDLSLEFRLRKIAELKIKDLVAKRILFALASRLSD
jgi:hypothetical protein